MRKVRILLVFIGLSWLISTIVLGIKQQGRTEVNDFTPPKVHTHVFKKTYMVGEEVKLNGPIIIVKKADVKKNATMHKLILYITAKQLNKGSWFLSSADFTLHHLDGPVVELDTADESYVPLAGDVHQGSEVSGELQYDVQPGKYLLYYQPYYLQGKSICWELTIADPKE